MSSYTRLNPAESAWAASLRYVTDARPGIACTRVGSAFRYFLPDGKPVRGPETLARIKALAIPPAWQEVWICPRHDGHVQATGRDARGRKQYRYHRRWREVRSTIAGSRPSCGGCATCRAMSFSNTSTNRAKSVRSTPPTSMDT
jgi:DNA topoisomerase-1